MIELIGIGLFILLVYAIPVWLLWMWNNEVK